MRLSVLIFVKKSNSRIKNMSIPCNKYNPFSHMVCTIYIPSNWYLLCTAIRSPELDLGQEVIRGPSRGRRRRFLRSFVLRGRGGFRRAAREHRLDVGLEAGHQESQKRQSNRHNYLTVVSRGKYLNYWAYAHWANAHWAWAHWARAHWTCEKKKLKPLT